MNSTEPIIVIRDGTLRCGNFLAVERPLRSGKPPIRGNEKVWTIQQIQVLEDQDEPLFGPVHEIGTIYQGVLRYCVVATVASGIKRVDTLRLLQELELDEDAWRLRNIEALMLVNQRTTNGR